MNEIFLQSFLRTGLFDIGDSDERLKWLRQAIEALEKKFSDNPTLLPAYTLVALDPNISDTEPVLIEKPPVSCNEPSAFRYESKMGFPSLIACRKNPEFCCQLSLGEPRSNIFKKLSPVAQPSEVSACVDPNLNKFKPPQWTKLQKMQP